MQPSTHHLVGNDRTAAYTSRQTADLSSLASDFARNGPRTRGNDVGESDSLLKAQAVCWIPLMTPRAPCMMNGNGTLSGSDEAGRTFLPMSVVNIAEEWLMFPYCHATETAFQGVQESTFRPPQTQSAAVRLDFWRGPR